MNPAHAARARAVQSAALLGLELRRWVFGARGIPLYVMAFFPPVILALRAAFLWTVGPVPPLAKAVVTFAAIWQGFTASAILYILCLWLFTSLFRMEVGDGTLHYFFLSPMRRDVLVLVKYVAGVLLAGVLGTLSLAASLFLFYLPHGAAGLEHFLTGAGMQQAASYLLMTWLACAGYGAVFLLAGIVFRNPLIPGAVFWGWERINFLLPPLLKKISVVYYLTGLAPVPVPHGPFEITSEPIPAVLAIPGLLGFGAVVLLVAVWRVRRMEVLYGGD